MKSNLIAVLSPAKLIEDKIHYPEIDCSQPNFLPEAETIVNQLRKKSAPELSKLMSMSAVLGEETKRRFMEWHLPFNHDNAIPALLMFRGEVYRGLSATDFSPKDLEFANEHLLILSGLYGVLKPLDLVMPYRLMMGTNVSIQKGQKNLYSFWGDKIHDHMNKTLDRKGKLINLASLEYSRALHPQKFENNMLECEFMEKKGDKFSVVSTYAKFARGRMARFLVKNRISKAEDLKNFDADGYKFNKKLSHEDLFIFTR